MGNLCGWVVAPMKIDVGSRRIDDEGIPRRAFSRKMVLSKN